MRRELRSASVLAVTAVASLALAACGSSKSSTSAAAAAGDGSSSTSGVPTASPGGACGSIPTQMPPDPDRVLAQLPKSVQAAYDLFPQTVYASAWARWKPSHPGPYTLYFSPGNVSTPYTASMAATFSQLKATSGVIKNVITQDANNNVQTQIQQIQQAIREKVDVIAVLPLSPAADAPVFAAAGKAGIPVIAPLNGAGSKYVVGLDGNIILDGAYLMQGLAAVLHDKGSILEMQGIPGVEASDYILKGAGDVLKRCPNLNIAGSPVGEFTPSVAKAQTLQFLTSHPQQISGAIQVGGMATGIMQAFIQTGRKVPAIADDGATPGALAYWRQHKSTYSGVALGNPPGQLADATWNLALGMLAGRGVRISDISAKPLIITNANLGQWVQPGWSLSTPIAYAPGPANVFSPSAYLNQFFSKPAK